MLMNMHHPPVEGSFCDEHVTSLKAAIVQDYDRYMGYGKKSYYLMNTDSNGRQTWKLTKICFPNQMPLSDLNSFIILTFCSSILSYQNFRLAFLRDLIQDEGKDANQTTLQGRQIPSPANQSDLTYNTVNVGPQKEISSVL
jgi:hypothetical protein